MIVMMICTTCIPAFQHVTKNCLFSGKALDRSNGKSKHTTPAGEQHRNKQRLAKLSVFDNQKSAMPQQNCQTAHCQSDTCPDSNQ